MGHLLGLFHPSGPKKGSSDLLGNLANMLTYPEPDMDRLMDYHAGTRLIRKEWEIINPQLNQ